MSTNTPAHNKTVERMFKFVSGLADSVTNPEMWPITPAEKDAFVESTLRTAMEISRTAGFRKWKARVHE